jgi:hypothetical protein
LLDVLLTLQGVSCCFCCCLQVYALGFVSVFDQILDGFDAGDKAALFSAYVKAIGEDPAQYRVSGEQQSGGAGLRVGRCIQQGLQARVPAASWHVWMFDRQAMACLDV